MTLHVFVKGGVLWTALLLSRAASTRGQATGSEGTGERRSKKFRAGWLEDQEAKGNVWCHHLGASRGVLMMVDVGSAVHDLGTTRESLLKTIRKKLHATSVPEAMHKDLISFGFDPVKPKKRPPHSGDVPLSELITFPPQNKRARHEAPQQDAEDSFADDDSQASFSAPSAPEFADASGSPVAPDTPAVSSVTQTPAEPQRRPVADPSSPPQRLTSEQPMPIPSATTSAEEEDDEEESKDDEAESEVDSAESGVWVFDCSPSWVEFFSPVMETPPPTELRWPLYCSTPADLQSGEQSFSIDRSIDSQQPDVQPQKGEATIGFLSGRTVPDRHSSFAELRSFYFDEDPLK